MAPSQGADSKLRLLAAKLSRRPRRQTEIRKAHPQRRQSTVGEAQHGFVDADAEFGRAGKARLIRQGHAHGQGDGAVDGVLGLAPHGIDDQRAHVVAGGVAPLGPRGREIRRAPLP